LASSSKQEQTAKYSSPRSYPAIEELFVGPFASLFQAQTWQAFMERRCKACPVLSRNDNENPSAPWYGLVTEQ